MKLTKHQQRKFASLLVNLSSQTVERILERFDETTRQAVRSQMFRASLVDNPFRGQNSLTKAIDTARHRDSNLKD